MRSSCLRGWQFALYRAPFTNWSLFENGRLVPSAEIDPTASDLEAERLKLFASGLSIGRDRPSGAKAPCSSRVDVVVAKRGRGFVICPFSSHHDLSARNIEHNPRNPGRGIRAEEERGGRDVCGLSKAGNGICGGKFLLLFFRHVPADSVVHDGGRRDCVYANPRFAQLLSKVSREHGDAGLRR